MKQFILNALAGFVLVAGVALLLFVSIEEYLELPTVRLTYPGEQCVEVHSPGNDYDCDNLPKKYIIEWVGEQQ